MKPEYRMQLTQTLNVVMKPEARERNLLIVDDEAAFLDKLEQQLQSAEYQVFASSSADSALEIVRTHPISVIITGQAMSGMDGIAFLKEVRKLDDDAVLIILTGHGSLEHAMTAINQLRIFSYLLKPCSLPIMKSVIKDAFRHHEMTTEYKTIMKRTYHLNEQLMRKNRQLHQRIDELRTELEIYRGLVFPLSSPT